MYEEGSARVEGEHNAGMGLEVSECLKREVVEYKVCGREKEWKIRRVEEKRKM